MKKIKKVLIAVFSFFTFAFSSFGVHAEEQIVETQQEMYRLYNPNSGEHFYTANLAEKDHLVSVGWYYEGIAWYAATSGTPVYRLYNPNAGDHHYTLNMAERDNLVSAGWKYEGVAWYSGGDIPMYRLYNPNATTGSHHYTTSVGERDYLSSVGWKYEGIAWYGLTPKVNTPCAVQEEAQNTVTSVSGQMPNPVQKPSEPAEEEPKEHVHNFNIPYYVTYSVPTYKERMKSVCYCGFELGALDENGNFVYDDDLMLSHVTGFNGHTGHKSGWYWYYTGDELRENWVWVGQCECGEFSNGKTKEEIDAEVANQYNKTKEWYETTYDDVRYPSNY